ncbi:ChuX/HutX family heme-like substrate-binding protein [Kushneria indalinina]|uniref:Putative hemin transport protein n=1 Tax=Kushneria indalinina DSM 14324 TaxID=1122140 RepID=A0A3D9DUG9_9GAMM|nr:ChuX/HutX family heme-like substrate-binding protein [Kushneria indalinina]REC94392.1 putative hemin transport protein [Kushneria indalinina DSM 14324]
MCQANVLFEAFEETRQRAPHMECRTLAALLDCSEGEIQASRLGRGVHSLALTPCDLVMMLPQLGQVQMVTRTSHAALSSRLEGCRIDADQHHASIRDQKSLAMQLLLPSWYWVCLSQERPTPAAQKVPCLQVFDRFGHVLHQLYGLTPEAPGWKLLEHFAALKSPRFTHRIDIANVCTRGHRPALLKAWEEMRGGEDFSRLLSRHHLRRVEANRAVAGHFSTSMAPERFIMTLAGTCRSTQPSQVSLVHGGGAHHHHACFRHFHQGRRGVLILESDQLTISFDSSALHEVWQVTRPGVEGPGTSLEAFDTRGEMMLALDLAETG